MKYYKFIIAIFILAGLLSCSKISEKVEQKVNQKIDEKLDEGMNKVDSAFKNVNLDSLKKSLEKIDSVSRKMDEKFKK